MCCGRLIHRDDGTTVTEYLYDGWNRIAEYGVAAGPIVTLAKTYTWGLDLSGTLQGAGGVGGLLSIVDKGTGYSYYPICDGNGNVSEYYKYILDSDTGTTDNQTVSAVAAHFEYDPFGNLTADTYGNAADFPFRFSTKPQDPVTGLYYYGYRWYGSLDGRWPSRDPIEEDGGLNLYEFVGNDGVDYSDALGLKTVSGIQKDGKFTWKYAFDANFDKKACTLQLLVKIELNGFDLNSTKLRKVKINLDILQLSFKFCAAGDQPDFPPPNN